MERIYNKVKNHPHAQRVLKNKHFQNYERFALVILWAGAIYFLSSRPLAIFVVVDYWEFLIRKLAHMFEFAVLTFLIFRVFKYTEKRHVYWDMFGALTLAIVYAIFDEYHQTFVPGRTGTYTDVLIDSAGILIASWLIFLHYHYEKVRQLKYRKQKSLG